MASSNLLCRARAHVGATIFSVVQSASIAMTIMVFISPSATAGTSSPSPGQRPKSERAAASVAADLGLQLHEWPDTVDDHPASGQIHALDAATADSSIVVGADVLNVTLVPRPSDVRKQLPRSSAERYKYAFNTAKEWRTQARKQLERNDYLFAHYMIGESIGSLRTLLSPSTDGINVQPNIDKLVTVINSVIGSSTVGLSESIRAKWSDIALDLLSEHALARKVALRARLQLWFTALSAELHHRAG